MKPSIVVLTSYYRPVMGGVESNAERLAQYLVTQGYPVRVVTKRVNREWPDLEEIDGVDVERIGPVGRRSAAGKWQLAPFAAAWLLRHAASYDVVCCIDYRGVSLGALAARAWTGRPLLVQAQTTGVLSGANADDLLGRLGIPHEGILGRRLKALPRTLYGRADAFACISHEIEREVLTCGIPQDRVHYVPNAIDMRRFQPASDRERADLKRQYDVPSDVVACLFVGRLSREKGLMDLMEAWRLLTPTKARLLVVGPDMEGHPWNEGPEARAFAEAHGLDASVQFLGPLVDVTHVMKAADILVQPSHFEALGLSAIEALACGVPVVASAVGGLLEFVVDNKNGRLCQPQAPAGLAAALRALLDDESLRQRLASRARASVADTYDEQRVFAGLASIVEQLARTSLEALAEQQ